MIRKKSTRGPSWRQRSSLRSRSQGPCESEKQQTDDLTCKVCGRTFHKREMLKLHLVTHSMTTKPATSSQVGNEETVTEKESSETGEVHGSGGGQVTSDKSGIEKSKEENVMEASGCSTVVTRQASSSSKDDEDEERNVSDDMYKCIACGKEYEDQKVLDSHVIQTHGARLKCQCQVCNGKKRSDAASLMEEDHVKDGEEEIRIFRCIICKSVFFLGCKCLCHIEQNHNLIILKYPFECANCGKMFELASFLAEHQAQEHQQLEKLSRCGYCKDSFELTSSLDNHIHQLHRITKDPIIYEGTTKDESRPPVTDIVSSSSSTHVVSRKHVAIAKKSTSPRPQPPVPFVSSTSSDIGADELMCEICNKRSQSRAGYVNHMVAYHKIKLDDLPLVMASSIGEKLSRKRRKASSADGDTDSDENWRPSRTKTTGTPMRSSTRIALAASRREVKFGAGRGKDALKKSEDEAEVTRKVDDSDEESNRPEKSSEPDVKKDEEEDFNSSNREEIPDAAPSDSQAADWKADAGPAGSQGEDWAPDAGPPGCQTADSDADVGSSSSQTTDSNEEDDEADKCKNCPACKQEAARAAAAKALAESQAIKTESQAEMEGGPNKQPQLIIKDVFSLNPSGNNSSSSPQCELSHSIGVVRPTEELSAPTKTTHRHLPQVVQSFNPAPPLPDMPPSNNGNCASCSSNAFTSRCDHCNMVFLDEVMHTIHMGWHGRTNPFDCHACGRQCSDKYGFITHIFRDSHM